MTTEWVKSRKSAQNGSCVEMRRNGPDVEVRDTKDPDGAVQRQTLTGFTAWLNGAKQGEFDHLAD